MEFDFEKNKTVDSVDKVPEPLRPFYVQGDNGYTISDEFAPIGGVISGLNKALKAARKENGTLKKGQVDLAPYHELASLLGIEDEDIDATKLRTGIEGLIEGAKAGKDVKVNMDKLRTDLKKGFDKEISKKDEALQGMTKTLSKHMIIGEATRHIAAAKGVPELLLPIIERSAKVVEEDGEWVVRVVDAAGDVRGDGKGGMMDIAGLVAELKASSAYGRAFESEQKGGQGVKPGQHNQQVRQQQQGDKSPMDKIKAGLARRG